MVRVSNNFLDENLQNLGLLHQWAFPNLLPLNTKQLFDIGELGSPEGKVSVLTFVHVLRW